MKISIPSGPAPVFLRYAGQHAPQRAIVEIDPERRTISAFPDAEVGGAVPFAVWYGRVLRLHCTPYASEQGLRDWVAANIEGIERLMAGHSVHGEHGRLTNDASDLVYQLERSLVDIPVDDVWDAEDVIGDEYESILDDVRRDGARAVAKDIVDACARDGIIVDGGVDAVMRAIEGCEA
jgi:hypothetical protein